MIKKTLLTISLTIFLWHLSPVAYGKSNIPKEIRSIKDLLVWYEEFSYQIDLDGHFKNPNETIRDKGGDCEDFAILSCTALKRMKKKCKVLIIYWKTEGHAIAVFKEDNGKWSVFDNRVYRKFEEDNIRDILNNHYKGWRSAFLTIKGTTIFYRWYRNPLTK